MNEYALDEQYVRCNSYIFDFTPSGLFTLINKRGEPLYESALPLFEKMTGHLIWIFFWLVLIVIAHFTLPVSWQYFSDRLFMSLIFLHLFFFGCRLTTLLIHGGLKPILFPPLWVRLTRKLQKGRHPDLLKKYNLQNHPGLLSNLALIHFAHGRHHEAQQTINYAHSLAPDHPILSELQIRLTHIRRENTL